MSSVTNTPSVRVSERSLLASEADVHEESLEEFDARLNRQTSLKIREMQQKCQSLLTNTLQCLKDGNTVHHPNEAFIIAASDGNLDAVQLLIKKITPQIEVLGTALVQAAGYGRLEVVIYLLHQKISTHYLHAAHLLAELDNHPGIAEILRLKISG